MATKPIVNGVIYITTGTVSGNVITYETNKLVEIWSAKIEYDYNNELISIPITVSKGNRGDITPFVRMIDLKRINEVITVQGSLEDEDSESAKDKRNNLLTMGKEDGALTVVWNEDSNNEQTLWTPDTSNNNYGGFINKIKFTETAGKLSESKVDTTPERKIDVNIQLIRGKDL